MTHVYWLVYKWQTIITFWASLFFDLHQITLFGDRGKYMHAYNFTKCVIEQLAVEPTSSDWELGLIETPLDWLRVQCSSHYNNNNNNQLRPLFQDNLGKPVPDR